MRFIVSSDILYWLVNNSNTLLILCFALSTGLYHYLNAREASQIDDIRRSMNVAHACSFGESAPFMSTSVVS